MLPSRHHLQSILINALPQVEPHHVDDLALILQGAAPGLERLQIDEGHWHDNLEVDPQDAPSMIQLADLAPHLVNLRSLKLHISFVKPHTLFDSLAQLPRLSNLNINEYSFEAPEYSARTILCRLDSFRAFLRRSPSIRFVELPESLFNTWFDENPSHPEWLVMREGARERGCEIEFVEP